MHLIALGVIACSCADAHVSCAPTLTCSYHDARFKPAPIADAGVAACDEKARRCRAASISAGGAHSCAIAQAGELFCWGSDDEGQLGRAFMTEDAGTDGGANSWSQPAIERAAQVSAGAAHTCALTDRGNAECFGRDAEGQVSGIASEEAKVSPFSVSIDKPQALAAGAAHSCALTAAGIVCWGSAEFGQVGRAIMAGALAPELVAGTAGAVEVAAGVRHTCARFASGHVACWGELIDPDSLQPRASAEPSEVAELDDAIEITAGAGHSCALRKMGAVVCWGRNDSGQLGNGTTDASAKPSAVLGLDTAIHIAAGGGLRGDVPVGHSCAVDAGFFAWCWGSNSAGQLGIGKAADSTRAVAVLGRSGGDAADKNLGDVIAIAAGAFHSCALDHDGPVLCWGDNSAGQLGAHRDPFVFGRAVRVALFSRRD